MVKTIFCYPVPNLSYKGGGHCFSSTWTDYSSCKKCYNQFAKIKTGVWYALTGDNYKSGHFQICHGSEIDLFQTEILIVMRKWAAMVQTDIKIAVMV